MDDSYVSCPYNVYHRVPQSRIQRHLVKCPDFKDDWACCPFNYSHRMPKNELGDHMKVCKLGNEINPALAYPKGLKQQKQQIPEKVPADEIWD